MLAHFDSYHGDTGCLEFRLADEVTTTPEVPVIAGELLWAQDLILPLYSDSTDDSYITMLAYVDGDLVG